MAQPLFRVQRLLEDFGRGKLHQTPGPGHLCGLLQELRGEEVRRLPEPHHRSRKIHVASKLKLRSQPSFLWLQVSVKA